MVFGLNVLLKLPLSIPNLSANVSDLLSSLVALDLELTAPSSDSTVAGGDAKESAGIG